MFPGLECADEGPTAERIYAVPRSGCVGQGYQSVAVGECGGVHDCSCTGKAVEYTADGAQDGGFVDHLVCFLEEHWELGAREARSYAWLAAAQQASSVCLPMLLLVWVWYLWMRFPPLFWQLPRRS